MIPGEIPSKPVQVVIVADGQSESVAMWGANLPCLLDDYKKAIKEAKALTKKDKKIRHVVIRQILVMETT